MFFLKDTQIKSSTTAKQLKIYTLKDIEITYEAGDGWIKRHRMGRFCDLTKIPIERSGLSSNVWHINFCGEGLYGLHNVIKELLTNDIYTLVLGYSPDTLCLYDATEKMFCRASRNIENAKIWGLGYSGIYAIDNYELLEDGALQDKQGKIKPLFGLASIAVVAFLLGEGDMHGGQYLLQECAEKLLAWKIDNEYSFSCRFPVNEENLQKLPFYRLPQLGIYKSDSDAYAAKKASGTLTEDEKCQVLENGFRCQFDMSSRLPIQLVNSVEFQDEKTAAMRKLLASQETIAKMLDLYCNPSNHDLENLKECLSSEDYAGLPRMLSDLKLEFGQWLERLHAPALVKLAQKNSHSGAKLKVA